MGDSSRLYVRFLGVIALWMTLGHYFAFSQPAEADQLDHPRVPATIIVKLKNPLTLPGKASLSGRISSLPMGDGIVSVTPTLSWTSGAGKQAKTDHPLRTIYTITITRDEDMALMLSRLRQSPEVLYAEPKYEYAPLIIPNDPKISEQYYLDLIQAFDAWNVEQGDTSVVVGILDTGVDLQHPELTGRIAYNFTDPINGVDDDGDGLVDNYYGWDIANNDNIPQADTDAHGTAVSGVVAAQANNLDGIAGVALNSRIMPIKIFQSGSNGFAYGFEAIALAADLGCKVINLSWGEENLRSEFGQDIINYAVLQKDVAIVAAAGNTNGSLDFYPASYDHVLSVAATNEQDVKASWATYGPFVDLSAPGEKITTTFNNNTYITTSGSSMSAPMVAAALALIRSRFPHLTARQAMERVRVNTDELYDKPQNMAFAHQLGHGRLNLFKALTNINSPAIRIKEFTFDNGHEKAAYYNDTVYCEVSFENFLYPASGILLTVSSPSPYVTVITPQLELPVLGTLESTPEKQVIKLVLSPDTPPDNRVMLLFQYEGELYQDYEYRSFRTSPSWYTMNNGRLALTIAGNGNLGYESDQKKDGVGLTFDNMLIASNLGVLFRSGAVCMDNIPYNQGLYVRQKDFTTRELLRVQHNSPADHFVRSSFAPPPLNTPTLPLEIEQEVFSWDNEAAIVLEYFVTNTSDSVLHEFQPAFVADYDLSVYQKNRAASNESDRYLFQQDREQSVFAGLALADTLNGYMLGIDKRNANGNNADIPVVLTDEKKATFFSGDPSQASAGQAGEGNDVEIVTGKRATDLLPGAQVRFTVILAAASSQEELTATIRKARERYQQIMASPPVLYVAEHCPGVPAQISTNGTHARFYSDASGTELLKEGTQLTDSVHTRIYVSLQKNGHFADIMTIPIRERSVNADFSISQSPFLLDESGKTLVRFTDQSDRAVLWDWKFSNGYHAITQHPQINFTETGNYSITLTATSDLGCVGTTTKALRVARKSDRPEDLSVTGCAGEPYEYSSGISDQLKIYADDALTTLITASDVFQPGDITHDTIFYITNSKGEFESNPALFTIDIIEIDSDFTYDPDTLDLLSKNKLLLHTPVQPEVTYHWFVTSGSSPVTQSLGSGPEATYAYSQEDFDVTLYASHSSGCQQESTQTIHPSLSPVPDIAQQLSSCKDAPVTLRPQTGNQFQFYGDANLTNLLHKGRAFALSALQKDTVIYVVSVDSLIGGPARQVAIKIDEVSARFQVPEGPLDINATPSITLTDTGQGAASRVWYVNDIPAGDQPDFTFSPEFSGNYKISLEATSSMNCTSSTTKNIQVVRITGTEEDLSGISVFPNPTSSILTIAGTFPDHLRLITADGKTVLYECGRCTSLSMESYAPGVYFLQLLTGDQLITYKVVRN